MKISFRITGLLFLFSLFACKKFISLSPPKTALVSSNVFENDASAESALSGIYSKMMESSTGAFSGGESAVGPLCGLAADELKNFSTIPEPAQFFQNAISPNNSLLINGLWGSCYQYIYAVNALLEGVSSSKELSLDVRTRVAGEARFLRALYYFYLVNLFDSIPLITTTDYLTNQRQPRSAISAIYQQIQRDLEVAAEAFRGMQEVPGPIHPGISAVRFLQSRMYLFMHDWADAKKVSDTILSSNIFSLSPDLDIVFRKESPETIWQLMPVNHLVINTWDAHYYILKDYPVNATLSPSLLSAFDPGDQRRIHWVDSIVISGNVFYFPSKYKILTADELFEYQVVFRLSESFLIRAEAEAELGNLTAADSDLNLIRGRAGLDPVNSLDLNSFLIHVIHERQTELFTEWGHRWFDLRRTGFADIVLGAEKGADWQPTDVWFPIPQPEIEKDNLLTQNAGY